MCFNLRQTLKSSIASPQNNQFGWRIFLQSVTKDRNTSTYLIQVVRSIFQTFSYYHIKPYYGPHSSLTLIPRVSKSSPKPAKIAELSLRGLRRSGWPLQGSNWPEKWRKIKKTAIFFDFFFSFLVTRQTFEPLARPWKQMILI